MKKITLTLSAFALIGSAVAQSAYIPTVVEREKANVSLQQRNQFKQASSVRASGPFDLYVEPVGDVMNAKGIDISGSSTTEQDLFLAGVYQDSTVQISSPSSTRYVDDILIGSICDPKSSYLQASFEPIVSKADSYTLDSIFILGSYVKVTPAIDTLYTWIVWGDSTTTTVFSKRANSSIWVAPISTWRTSILGAKINGFIGTAGNKVTAAAPALNKMLIKYPLTDADSSGAGFSKYIGMEVNAVIPAGNVVSAFYTFVPGGSYTTGDVMYSFTGASLSQTVNGFAGIVWGQTDPAVTAVGDYRDHQVDIDGWNMGVSYYKEQRHNVYSSTYNNSMWGNLVSAPVIIYNIYGNSTVAVNDMESQGFSVGSVYPNPSFGQATISFNLLVSADVNVAIYDLSGRMVATQSQSSVAPGIHTMDMDLSALSDGVYFYTFTANGHQVTKKMVIAK
jgi:hypothetical protein